jgi:succinate dehydrogenase / fumarate reductase cytochrome b subunit
LGSIPVTTMTNVLQAPDPQPSSSYSPLLRFYRSPIGKKLLSGLTGLALVTFVVVHMVGNLWLWAGRQAYNAYAHHLESWGGLLYAIEVLLLLALLVHVAVGLEIFVGRLRARPQGYQHYQSVGGDSYQSLGSRSMVVTGGGLGMFLVAHLLTFKFGPQYSTELQGETVRDLSQLVVEVFRQPIHTLIYSAVLLGLGLHLRHGLWSALQSLGLLQGTQRSLAVAASLVLAIAIILGFGVLPWAVLLGVIS